jgi:MFS family permease
MKAKKWVWGIFIAALVIGLVMISLENFYVAIALLVGAVILRYREIWSVLRWRRLPPVDERVRENTSRSIRNAFVFLALAIGVLLLPFGLDIIGEPGTMDVLAVLFLAVGLVYFLSCIYYDRAEPRMTEKRRGLMRRLMLIAGLSLGVGVIAVFLHNLVSMAFGGFEEPVFFIIGVIAAPLGVVVGLLGSLVVYIMGLAAGAD